VVGKYNSGASPYGLFDMAGNAQEWVNDWYQANYYSSFFGDVENPQGPLTGDERVIRGGSWDAGKNFIRTTYRFKSSPSVSFYNISFRCAKDVP
ncbi:MAG: SUMF1/EgtB/PvdO family nonheme iron enzyme, partial [Anaerolineales bacterium]|nr:SUMF1/EgtB/PvdO family nonheme iron enzyme [Anaerolineales bacterium]